METDNSGFSDKAEVEVERSLTFADIIVLRQRGSHVLASAVRYGRRWLLKGLTADAAESTAGRHRLMKEYEILASLSHPGIVGFNALEEVPGVGLCIVMEWIEGPTLEEALQKGELTRAERLRILREIVEAMAYLHGKGIVHRDIKPSNIMIRNNGRRAVILDFDLADTDAFTILKHPAGTEGYISERQRTADTPFTADDVYSLGVVMRSLYPEYGSIIRRCTGRPDRRYRDASELMRAIRFRGRHKRMILSALTAVVFIGAAIVVGILIYRNQRLDVSMTEIEGRLSELTERNYSDSIRNGEQRRQLSDSINLLNDRLATETAYRESQQQYAAGIHDTSKKLEEELNSAYRQFVRDRGPFYLDSSMECAEKYELAALLEKTQVAFLSSLPSMEARQEMEFRAYAKNITDSLMREFYKSCRFQDENR